MRNAENHAVIPVLIAMYEFWTKITNIISVKTCISSISIASNFIIGKEKKVPIKGETERSFHFRHHRGMIRLNVPPQFFHLTLSLFVFCMYTFMLIPLDLRKSVLFLLVTHCHHSIPLSHPFIALFVVHPAIIQEKKAIWLFGF